MADLATDEISPPCTILMGYLQGVMTCTLQAGVRKGVCREQGKQREPKRSRCSSR